MILLKCFVAKLQAVETPQAALLHLSGGLNNAHQATPNSPQHILKIILVSLAKGKEDVKDYQAIKTLATTLVTKGSNTDLSKLFEKATDVLDLLSELYCHPEFLHLSITPSALLSLHQDGWAMFNTLVGKNWLLLKYLASPLPLPSTSTTSTSSWDIFNIMQPLPYISTPILNIILANAQTHYHHCLSSHMSSFGTASQEFQDAYNIYFKSVCKGILEDMEMDCEEWNEEDLKVMNLVENKLITLLGPLNKQAYGPGLLPSIVSEMPLLCHGFFKDLMTMLIDIAYPLNLVSFSFLNFGISFNQSDTSFLLGWFLQWTLLQKPRNPTVPPTCTTLQALVVSITPCLIGYSTISKR